MHRGNFRTCEATDSCFVAANILQVTVIHFIFVANQCGGGMNLCPWHELDAVWKTVEVLLVDSLELANVDCRHVNRARKVTNLSCPVSSDGNCVLSHQVLRTHPPVNLYYYGVEYGNWVSQKLKSTITNNCEHVHMRALRYKPHMTRCRP